MLLFISEFEKKIGLKKRMCLQLTCSRPNLGRLVGFEREMFLGSLRGKVRPNEAHANEASKFTLTRSQFGEIVAVAAVEEKEEEEGEDETNRQKLYLFSF